MEAIFAHKRQVSEQLAGGIEAMFKSSKVELLRGIGTITAPNTVQVAGAEGTRTYTADEFSSPPAPFPSVRRSPGWICPA